MWKLNNTLLNKEKVTKLIRKHFERNENEDTTYQNLLVIAKAVLRGKLIAVNTYI